MKLSTGLTIIIIIILLLLFIINNNNNNDNNNNNNQASNLKVYYNSYLNQDVTKGKPQNHITGQITRHPNQ